MNKLIEYVQTDHFVNLCGVGNLIIIFILVMVLIGHCVDVRAGEYGQGENALIQEFHGQTFSPEPPQTVTYVDTSWTPWNIGMFSFMIMGHAADIGSTQRALDRGLVEANPIYGEDPSTGKMVLIKAVMMGITYWYTEYYLVPNYGTDMRNWSYGISGLISTGAAIWNESQ